MLNCYWISITDSIKPSCYFSLGQYGAPPQGMPSYMPGGMPPYGQGPPMVPPYQGGPPMGMRPPVMSPAGRY